MGFVAHCGAAREPFQEGGGQGIDGNLYCSTKHEGRAIVSVKADENVQVSMICDLRGVIEREGAVISVFLPLAPPSRPMLTEAAGAGQFELPGFAPVPLPLPDVFEECNDVLVPDRRRVRHRIAKPVVQETDGISLDMIN